MASGYKKWILDGDDIVRGDYRIGRVANTNPDPHDRVEFLRPVSYRGVEIGTGRSTIEAKAIANEHAGQG